MRLPSNGIPRGPMRFQLPRQPGGLLRMATFFVSNNDALSLKHLVKNTAVVTGQINVESLNQSLNLSSRQFDAIAKESA